MNTRQCWWLICGFLLAPLAAALTSVLISLIGPGTDSLSNLFFAVLFIYLFSAPIIMTVGVPALALAHHFNMVRWWIAMPLGLLCGALLRLVGHFDQFNEAWLMEHGFELLSFSLSGAAPALLVWWCWHFAYMHSSSQHGS